MIGECLYSSSVVVTVVERGLEGHIDMTHMHHDGFG